MIFKGNGKTYFVLNKTDKTNKAVKKSEAIRIANKHFKVKLEALEVVSGVVKGDDLFIGFRGDYWVVYRR